jgi:hypothetical protein
VLAALGVFPYRCSDCRARFRRFHPNFWRDVVFYVHGAPNWARRLAWGLLAVLLGLAACLFVLLRIAR